MSSDLIFETEKAFRAYAKENPTQVLVIHKGIVYNVTEFVDSHPGGKDFILDFRNEDITLPFRSEEYHDHSDNALRMLSKYRIGIIKEKKVQQGGVAGEEETESYPRITKEKVEYRDFSIDLTVGMVPQVLKLTKAQYLHMIHNPIHLPYCRLFKNSLLEGLSRNPWYNILITWIPVSLYLVYSGITSQYAEGSFLDKFLFNGSPDFSILAVALTFFFGVLFWTFGEYTLHRGVFHLDEYLPDNKYALYLHFLIHGIHHTIPMDPDRLVLPPVLGIVAYMLVFSLVSAVFPGNLGRIIYAGFVMTYAFYDVMHLFLHHGNPWVSHLKEMKKYHLKHHYVDGTRGYGITTKIWDKVFRTELL